MMAEPRRRTGRVMCVFATLSSGQRGRKAVRWVGKCVNEVKAVWMPEWQNGREREERKETDREKIKKDMWAWRAARGQLFHHAAGEEKAKNTLQLFSTKGGSEKRRECKIGRRKKELFPLHHHLILLLLEAVLPSPRFFFLVVVSLRRNQSRQLCYSTLFGSGGV